jgi:hypothetical protein
MAKTKFKIGDWVICINAQGAENSLEKNIVYKVTWITEFNSLKFKQTDGRAWYPSRFIKVDSELANILYGEKD